MKKSKIVLVGVVIASICLFYYFTTDHQRIHGLNIIPENGVQAYVYALGCIEKGHSIPINQTDYESLLQIVSEIKFMNPNIDPFSINYIVYGGGGYEFEMVSDNSRTTFGISCNELEPNIRRVTLSDGKIERSISAYVNNGLYQKYQNLAKKYITES